MENLKETVIINEVEYIIKNKNDLIQKVLLSNRQWNNNILLLIGQFIKPIKSFFLTSLNATLKHSNIYLFDLIDIF